MVAEKKHDWASDYDIFDPEYIRDPYPIWDELRGKCPIAHSERWSGSWLPTRFEDVFDIAQDPARFSSRSITVTAVPPPAAGDYGVVAMPISVDAPTHTWSRRLLLPAFNLRSVEKWESVTRDLCRSLIDGFADKGRADAAAGYAQQIPVRVIAGMLGVSTDMSDTFTDWVRGVLEIGLQNPEIRIKSRQAIIAFFRECIAEGESRRETTLSASCSPPRSMGTRWPRTTSLASACFFWSPASTPPGAPSAPPSGTWRPTTKTAGASRPTPA